MPTALTESEVEEYALDILYESGYTILHDPDIAPNGIAPEKQDYSEVVLIRRLRDIPLPKLLSSELSVDALKIINEHTLAALRDALLPKLMSGEIIIENPMSKKKVF